MTNFKAWVRAFRVPFFTATIVPVVLGSAAAWHDTSLFSWPKFWLALIGAVLIHSGTNLANDYFDHLSGCDEANPNPTPFSGGSRVIQEGLIPARKVIYMSSLCFLLGGVIGLYLNYLSGKNVILTLGIIGIFLGIFYTAKPFRIGYGSFGELAVGIGFGPLMVLGAYYVQAQNLQFETFFISIPIGILIALVLFINEFPDYEADRSVGKRTLVVILGKRNAMILYHILLSSVYLFVIISILLGYMPMIGILTVLSIPLALKAFSVAKDNFEKVYELLPANAATIALHSLIGVLITTSFILDKILWRK
ncbi:MAG: 1,4-dihydroxy-2-naphthoate octaprenyltransferase [Candidatus Omnitrophica bacterium]|nr:1,4-dihydroxy-2-naphthoate octaprenyltransferase [Candidatus Omnitrophota bacterium]